MAFSMRRARREDSEAIGRMHVASIRKLCGGHYSPDEIEAWAAPRESGFYVEAIERKAFYVAEESGRVVGFGTLDVESGEVEAVYVHPRAARRGVGSKLLSALEAHARAAGLEQLRLCASLNAVPFYERGGFVRQHETAHRLAGGAEIRCVSMLKELRRGAA
ncbi:MAG TPA: GNAT family N-acetyltransferase [Pyrinomonadaceae bacterium]|nr:GNAT family N-acetyltransferase [Pyrinomonadaceae bacterium]